jgi:hypothetical protein
MTSSRDTALAPPTAEPGPPAEPVPALRALEARLLEAVAANPLEATAAIVAGGAALLWAAEAGRNDRIQTYWDALHYVATSLSVGYANIFPETSAGKALGALLMMIGPALSSRALNKPEPAAPASAPSADAAMIAERLDAILEELKRRGGPR